ncbi:bifunctional diguanylate cyclase/phosphodiesterase [Thioclava sp. GXIMD4216]|uniref:putative bifunctional diguanylate cyclase/phosphodiesterase n=1 Tax=Thioclava sp. GXIMD4216 TaxID=3131929 RepID=UPI0030D51DD3
MAHKSRGTAPISVTMVGQPFPPAQTRGTYQLHELEMRNLRAAHWQEKQDATLDATDSSPLLLQDLSALAQRLTGATRAHVTLAQDSPAESRTEGFTEGRTTQEDALSFGLEEVTAQSHLHGRATPPYSCSTEDYVFYSHGLFSETGRRLGGLSTAFPTSAPACAYRAEQLDTTAQLLAHTLAVHLEKQALQNSYQAAQRRAKRLEREAEVDPLTQVENHCSFERKVAMRLDLLNAKEAQGAFIMLDIDHFKSINDIYGHSFGDKYLRIIASAITSAFPPPAIVGRVGGDEFGIFVETGRTSSNYLETLLSRCRSAVQRGAAMLGKADLGRVSIGASLFPSQGRSFSHLFELADSALYASKHAGRAVNTIFSPSHHERFNSRAIGRRFDEAIGAHRLEPYFQPIVDSGTGEVQGYEVLARWCDPQRGILLPDAFASIFKDYRLAETLTRTVLERALMAYNEAGLGQRGARPASLSINLTAFDLLNPEFVFDVQSMLNRHHLDWSMITIEVTEKVMLDERSGQILRSLLELRTRGAKVALDDFGTGYGGLRHLDNWPVDILKIDRSFCAKLSQSSSGGAIAEAILLIARKCGYEVVAEGVETLEQLQMLKAMGCPRAQGFLFARPMSIEDLIQAPTRYDPASPTPSAQK